MLKFLQELLLLRADVDSMNATCIRQSHKGPRWSKNNHAVLAQDARHTALGIAAAGGHANIASS